MDTNDIFNTLFTLAQDIEVTANARIATGIFMRNKPVAFGFNRMKSHPMQKKFGKNSECIYLHSEISAIKNALRNVNVDDLKKCDVYVCRVKFNQPKGWFIPGLAKPCSGCQRALRTFDVKNVFYSQNNRMGFECL
jgi:deoxycytidylate deaminase